MLSVTQLARKFNISRSTVLYYEHQGLLPPTSRTDNGYRWYGKVEQARLEQILLYRASGIPISQILGLLEQPKEQTQFNILKNHLHSLKDEIEKLKQQQKAIITLLQEPKLLEANMVTKERWVEIMVAAGFDEPSMIAWHQTFEQMEPTEHQKFLVSLGISTEEIQKNRNF